VSPNIAAIINRLLEIEAELADAIQIGTRRINACETVEAKYQTAEAVGMILIQVAAAGRTRIMALSKARDALWDERERNEKPKLSPDAPSNATPPWMMADPVEASTTPQ
jgi:hypothetical protein